MTSRYFDYTDANDIIDSRDIIARLEELQEEWEALLNDTTLDAKDAMKALEDWKEQNQDELDVLRAINEAGSREISDWESGATLVREDKLEDHAREDIESMYNMEKIPAIIRNNIDWKEVCEEWTANYSSITIGSWDYYARD